MKRLARSIGIQSIKWPFDLFNYLDRPPPQSMSWRRYVLVLERLQRMENLRTAIIFRGLRVTAREFTELTKNYETSQKFAHKKGG